MDAISEQDQTSAEGPWPWDKREELLCSLRLKWRPLGRITLDGSGKPRFPGAATEPGLYRFRIRVVGGIESNYIGETDNIRRRFGNYRNPGPRQQTSLRINRVLSDHLRAGSEISVAVAEEVWIENERGKARADLNRKSLRRLFENFALAVEQASEVESLNR
jgi:hypothetical protein